MGGEGRGRLFFVETLNLPILIAGSLLYSMKFSVLQKVSFSSYLFPTSRLIPNRLLFCFVIKVGIIIGSKKFYTLIFFFFTPYHTSHTLDLLLLHNVVMPRRVPSLCSRTLLSINFGI